jgi:hypothetical protein
MAHPVRQSATPGFGCHKSQTGGYPMQPGVAKVNFIEDQRRHLLYGPKYLDDIKITLNLVFIDRYGSFPKNLPLCIFY